MPRRIYTSSRNARQSSASPSANQAGGDVLLETHKHLEANNGNCVIECNSANVFSHELKSSVNLVLNNPPQNQRAIGITLKISNGSAGHSITWPDSVRWASGSAPTLPASGVDIFTLFTHDAGLNWYGFTAGQNLS